MSQTSATVPEEWRALFEGRNVVFARLPPAPPKAASRVAKWTFRVAVIVSAVALAIGAGVGLSTASGRWWVGLIGFAIVAWIGSLLAIGMVGAMKVEREAMTRRRTRGSDRKASSGARQVAQGVSRPRRLRGALRTGAASRARLRCCDLRCGPTREVREVARAARSPAGARDSRHIHDSRGYFDHRVDDSRPVRKVLG